MGFDKDAEQEVKTDFTELSGSFVINDGVLNNRDLKMLAPLVRVNGSGLVPLPQQAIDYDMTATLVATLEGQGGKDSLAGLPIPIKIKGPWENISYKADWEKVFGSISADPERLNNLPQSLRNAGKNFGIDLPVIKLPEVLKSPDTHAGGGPLDLLRQLERKTSETPSESATTKESKEKEKPPIIDPSQLLKDLFRK